MTFRCYVSWTRLFINFAITFFTFHYFRRFNTSFSKSSSMADSMLYDDIDLDYEEDLNGTQNGLPEFKKIESIESISSIPHVNLRAISPSTNTPSMTNTNGNSRSHLEELKRLQQKGLSESNEPSLDEDLKNYKRINKTSNQNEPEDSALSDFIKNKNRRSRNDDTRVRLNRDLSPTNRSSKPEKRQIYERTRNNNNNNIDNFQNDNKRSKLRESSEPVEYNSQDESFAPFGSGGLKKRKDPRSETRNNENGVRSSQNHSKRRPNDQAYRSEPKKPKYNNGSRKLSSLNYGEIKDQLVRQSSENSSASVSPASSLMPGIGPTRTTLVADSSKNELPNGTLENNNNNKIENVSYRIEIESLKSQISDLKSVNKKLTEKYQDAKKSCQILIKSGWEELEALRTEKKLLLSERVKTGLGIRGNEGYHEDIEADSFKKAKAEFVMILDAENKRLCLLVKNLEKKILKVNQELEEQKNLMSMPETLRPVQNYNLSENQTINLLDSESNASESTRPPSRNGSEVTRISVLKPLVTGLTRKKSHSTTTNSRIILQTINDLRSYNEIKPKNETAELKDASTENCFMDLKPVTKDFSSFVNPEHLVAHQTKTKIPEPASAFTIEEKARMKLQEMEITAKLQNAERIFAEKQHNLDKIKSQLENKEVKIEKQQNLDYKPGPSLLTKKPDTRIESEDIFGSDCDKENDTESDKRNVKCQTMTTTTHEIQPTRKPKIKKSRKILTTHDICYASDSKKVKIAATASKKLLSQETQVDTISETLKSEQNKVLEYEKSINALEKKNRKMAKEQKGTEEKLKAQITENITKSMKIHYNEAVEAKEKEFSRKIEKLEREKEKFIDKNRSLKASLKEQKTQNSLLREKESQVNSQQSTTLSKGVNTEISSCRLLSNDITLTRSNICTKNLKSPPKILPKTSPELERRKNIRTLISPILDENYQELVITQEEETKQNNSTNNNIKISFCPNCGLNLADLIKNTSSPNNLQTKNKSIIYKINYQCLLKTPKFIGKLGLDRLQKNFELSEEGNEMVIDESEVDLCEKCFEQSEEIKSLIEMINDEK